MSDRRREQSTPPPIDADALARHTFSSSFRGYDIDEVRAYLIALAEDVRAINEHTSWLTVELAAAEQRATAHVQLDETRMTELLGEETDPRPLDRARGRGLDPSSFRGRGRPRRLRGERASERDPDGGVVRRDPTPRASGDRGRG